MPEPRYVMHVEKPDGNFHEYEFYNLGAALHTFADCVSDIEEGSSPYDFAVLHDRAFDNRVVVSFSAYDLGYEVN